MLIYNKFQNLYGYKVLPALWKNLPMTVIANVI